MSLQGISLAGNMKKGFLSHLTQCYVCKLKRTRKWLWSWSCTNTINVVPTFLCTELTLSAEIVPLLPWQPPHFHVTFHRNWVWIRTNSLFFPPNPHECTSEVKSMAHYFSGWISIMFSYGTQFCFLNIHKDSRELQLGTTRHLS